MSKLILLLSLTTPCVRAEGFSAYSGLVDLIQISTIQLNAKFRELSDRIYELEKAAVRRNTNVNLLYPLEPISYVELGCVGQNDGCCTASTPCSVGQGDCDSGHECATGLACGDNNCPLNASEHNERHLFNAGDDCCVIKDTRCLGKDDCCTSSDPCDEGEGDCDWDSHCRGPDLVCGSNNCLDLVANATDPVFEFHDFEEGDDCCVKREIAPPVEDRRP